MSIKIVLVDDHKILRDGLRNLLVKRKDMDVIGEAGDGRQALHLVEKTSPDVVIMDVNMPGLNGMEATKQIMAKTPQVKILALSMHSDQRFVVGMLQAGAAGFLVKACPFKELVHAIRTVVSHQTYLSADIPKTVMDNYKQIMTKSTASGIALLTTREREVLQLLAEGKATKQIAAALFLSNRTIEKHRQNIMEKLHLHNVADLIRFALREGLASMDM